MIWFEMTTVDGKKRLINANKIESVYYTAEEDMTIIETVSPKTVSYFFRGNIINEIAKLISRNDNCVLYRVGDK